jgi:hypothetical protein
MAISPPATAPFCQHCQLLSSHSCRCQPLLAFTAPIDGWLLCLSLLCHLLPTSLSAAPIMDTFFAGRRAILFLICVVLFLIAPLPPSTVVIHPTTALNLASHRAPLILWCGCLSSILAGCCVVSHHATASCLLAPLPVVLPLPLVVCHDWLLCCRLHLFLRHPLPSACSSTYLLPPPPTTNFFCPLLLRLIDALSFCQLWQWAKTSIPDNHDSNGNGNDGGNSNSNSNGDSNGIRDFSSIPIHISLSLFDYWMFYLGFGFLALLPLPLSHHLPSLPSPHLPTPLLPTASPPAHHLPLSLADF